MRVSSNEIDFLFIGEEWGKALYACEKDLPEITVNHRAGLTFAKQKGFAHRDEFRVMFRAGAVQGYHASKKE